MIKHVSYNGKHYYNIPFDGAGTDLPIEVIEKAVFDQKWSDVRVKRDSLMSDVDYTQMPDSPLTPDQKQAFADYRQALRDIPQNFDDPDAVIWPEKPTL